MNCSEVTRVEVIDENGRTYVRYGVNVELHLQDDGRTLKVFVKERMMENADKWWDSLSQEEQMKAFYSVVKRICKGELEDKGSYRYVLYEVFGFGPESYGMGMNCGYMALHNSIEVGE